MNRKTLKLFIFFVSCEWLLIALSPQLKSLTGSLVDTLSSHKATAILLPALSTLAGTPRQGTALIEESLQTKTPADRFAFISWFRHLLTPILPGLLFPVVLSIALNLDIKDVYIQLAPLVGIWLISGAILLRSFECLRIESHPGNKPLLKVTVIPFLLIVACLFLKDTHFLFAMWVAVMVYIVTDKESRALLKAKRQELQIVRWLMLAAGISVWTWVFQHISFPGHEADNLINLLAANLEGHKWFVIMALPFVAGFVSGHSFLSVLLTAPIAYAAITPSINGLLPCMGFAMLGTVLSPEHISFLSLQNQHHGSAKSIYKRLALPVMIAAAMLALISFTS